VKDGGESVSELMIGGGGEITRNFTQSSLIGVFLPFVYVIFKFVSCILLLVSSCVVCNCCWLTVCIVAVVLCVLLSYVYLLYYVGIVYFFLFPPLDAGLLARSQYSEGPATGHLDTGFFRVFHVLFTCKITTATG